MGIRVTVKLYALLGRYLPPGAKNHQVKLEVAEGSTLEDVFARFNVPRESCHLVLVNGMYIEPSRRRQYALQNGDVLAVWPPIAGG